MKMRRKTAERPWVGGEKKDGENAAEECLTKEAH